MAGKPGRNSPLLEHPRHAEICVQIKTWIEERRTGDYIWQALNAPPPEGWALEIGRASAYNYRAFVLKAMRKAEQKLSAAKRQAMHMATLDRVIALGFEAHDGDKAKYNDLAKAVRDLVELQARIDGTLGPTQLELSSKGGMYAAPPDHIVAVLAPRLQDATDVQQLLSEDT